MKLEIYIDNTFYLFNIFVYEPSKVKKFELGPTIWNPLVQI
jgi:hypothetical protein